MYNGQVNRQIQYEITTVFLCLRFLPRPGPTSLPVPPAVEVVRIAVQYKGGALLLLAAGPWTNNTTTLDHLVTELTCTGHVS